MAYSFQTFTTNQVLTAVQMNQVEANVRDHVHGRSSVARTGISWPRTEKTATFSVAAADAGEMFDCTSGTFAVTMGAAADLGVGFGVTIRNSGTGVITITPDGSETIDGGVDFGLGPNQTVTVFSDGTNLGTFGSNQLALDTDQAASGSSVTFTGIPTNTKRLTLLFDEVSLSGTDNIYVRLGDSVGIESAGYVSSGGLINTAASSITSAFLVDGNSGAWSHSGAMVLYLADETNNTWIENYVNRVQTNEVSYGGGVKSNLNSELTQLEISTSGSDTFDSGSFQLMYG